MNKEIEELAEIITNIYEKYVPHVCGKGCYNCCLACASNLAFFTHNSCKLIFGKTGRVVEFRNNIDAMNLLDTLKKKYNWNDKDGFLGKDGCVMSRSERSIHCQLTDCKRLKELTIPDDMFRIKDCLDRIKEIRIEQGDLI